MDEIGALRSMVRRGPWNGQDLNRVFKELDAINTIPSSIAHDLSFTPELTRFIQSSVVNGDFRVEPPDTSANLDDETNKLTGWDFVQSSGTAITASWVSPSTVRFSMAAGSAGDTSYIEQIIQVNQSRGRPWRYIPHATVSGGSTSAEITLSAQYLDTDGNTTGSEHTDTDLLSDAATELQISPRYGLEAPTNATHLRIRVKVARAAAATSATDTIDVKEVWVDAVAPYAPVQARAYTNTNQSINNAADKSLQFNSGSDFDSDDIVSSTHSYKRFTFPVSGMYHFGAGCEFASDPNGDRLLKIELNGIDGLGTRIIGAISRVAAASGSQTQLNVSGFRNFSAGDYIAATVRQSSGGALNVTECAFWGYLVNPTG